MSKNRLLLKLMIPYAVIALAIIAGFFWISMHEDVPRYYGMRIIFFGVAMIMVGFISSFWISLRVTTPLRRIKEAADQFSMGDFSHRLPPYRSDEIGGLAEAMNRMAERLDNQLRTISEQKLEREAILSSMSECVLAVDTDENIISVNNSLAELFDVSLEDVVGTYLQQAIRNVKLCTFARGALASTGSVEDHFTFHNPHGYDVHLRARGSVLRNSGGDRIGALIVLNDETKQHHLEQVQKDFAANVSHELRTPITTIKGFAETLLGDDQIPEESRRFLQIIVRQSDRLIAIIEDLLNLARIEQETERGEVSLDRHPLLPVLEASCRACRKRAEEHRVQLDMQCARDLELPMDPQLLEQAVVNLLDNAIKFSEEGQTVFLATLRNDDEVSIQVRDNGPGIEEQHIPRLFERFYRIDKHRSRKLGGTGLGLSIVKHIASAHRGDVSVQTRVGHGTTFTIRVPLAPVRRNALNGDLVVS